MRLVWLQVVRTPSGWTRRSASSSSTFEVAPQRGVLYDRNLRELAMTVLVDSIYVDPSELGENRASTAEMLAKLVHTDPTDGFTAPAADAARASTTRSILPGWRGGWMRIPPTACAS